MKSVEQIRSSLPPVCKGSVLPQIDVGPDKFDELFDIALSCVSDATETPEEDLMGRSRVQPCCTYRFMLYKIARHEIGGTYTRPSFSWIGERMDRDHGAVMHGIDRIEEYLESDRTVEPVYMRILSRFEIARAEYLSMALDEETNENVVGLKEAAATIARAIKKHESHLASVMEKLAKTELERADNEDMVQDKCSSDG